MLALQAGGPRLMPGIYIKMPVTSSALVTSVLRRRRWVVFWAYWLASLANQEIPQARGRLGLKNQGALEPEGRHLWLISVLCMHPYKYMCICTHIHRHK